MDIEAIRDGLGRSLMAGAPDHLIAAYCRAFIDAHTEGQK